MKNLKKSIALLVAVSMIVGCVIGGTLAWLTATTVPVTNTFTVGNVDITLAETTTDYKMVPGNTIAKDPKVTVVGGSEACWLFVKIDKSDNYGTYLEDYTLATGWTALTGELGVYYREVSASDSDQSFYVLGAKSGYTNGFVTVKDTVTKGMMDDIKNGTTSAPTLTFTAYAVQKDNVATAADAWTKANPTT